MVSQILSAVTDNRPLLYPAKLPLLIILTLSSAALGGSISFVRHLAYRWLLLGGAIAAIYGSALLSLNYGLWLPTGIQILSLTGTSLLVSLSHSSRSPQVKY